MSDELKLYFALSIAAEILDRRGGDLPMLNRKNVLAESFLRQGIDTARENLLDSFAEGDIISLFTP